jgi:transposase InsO family protein
VQNHAGEDKVARLCRALSVSKSGYYAWLKREPSRRAARDGELLLQIREAHARSRRTYGSPRIHAELRAEGTRCSEKRVARLMRAAGLSARRPRRAVRTTDSKHDRPVAPNLLGRDFSAPSPDLRWAADITYVPTAEGWLYLAVILDLFSRRVVGHASAATLATALVAEAWALAYGRRRPGAGLLHHSDRGSQYASAEYRARLSEAGAQASMSRRGDCYDNAVVESFFGTLKTELVHGRRYATRAEARSDIFDYVEVFYNQQRRHSALSYLSPAEYEARHAAAQKLPQAA